MKIQGEFAAERTTRNQADQGICLGLFQHGRRPGAEPSLGAAGSFATRGDQEVVGKAEYLAKNHV